MELEIKVQRAAKLGGSEIAKIASLSELRFKSPRQFLHDKKPWK